MMLWALLLLINPWMLPTMAQQTSVSNRGKNFIFAFPSNTVISYVLFTAVSIPTLVTFEYPKGVKSTLTATPGFMAEFKLPGLPSTTPNTITSTSAVQVYAENDIVVYVYSTDNRSDEVAMALPITALNIKYVLLDQTVSSTAASADFSITAPFNNTKVFITPSVPITGHPTVGKSFQVALNAGETYYGAAGYFSTGATGTIVEATRPVSVSNGFAGRSYFEIAQPVQNWGLFYAAAPLAGDTTTYRIVVAQSQTSIFLNGLFLASIDPLKFKEITSINPVVLTSTKPFFVAQYPKARESMVNLVPVGQFLNAYTFHLHRSGYVSIIATNSDVGKLKLDGAVVNASQFTRIAGSTLSYARVSISEFSGAGDGRTHTTSSPNGHGITVVDTTWGFIYPGGFKKISPPPTRQPTKKPTPRPTKKPTPRPTVKSPTRLPTKKPTTRPNPRRHARG